MDASGNVIEVLLSSAKSLRLKRESGYGAQTIISDEFWKKSNLKKYKNKKQWNQAYNYKMISQVIHK